MKRRSPPIRSAAAATVIARTRGLPSRRRADTATTAKIPTPTTRRADGGGTGSTTSDLLGKEDGCRRNAGNRLSILIDAQRLSRKGCRCLAPHRSVGQLRSLPPFQRSPLHSYQRAANAFRASPLFSSFSRALVDACRPCSFGVPKPRPRSGSSSRPSVSGHVLGRCLPAAADHRAQTH